VGVVKWIGSRFPERIQFVCLIVGNVNIAKTY